MDLVLAKLCENLVDVIQETFTKKYYIAGITQSKRRHIYLIFRKKDASCCMKKKRRFTLRFLKLLRAFSTGILKDTHSWKYFLNLKLIKECSGYHFHYFLISRGRYTNEKH